MSSGMRGAETCMNMTLLHDALVADGEETTTANGGDLRNANPPVKSLTFLVTVSCSHVHSHSDASTTLSISRGSSSQGFLCRIDSKGFKRFD